MRVVASISILPIPIPFRPGSVNAFRVPLNGGGWMLVDGGLALPAAWEALDDQVGRLGGWDGLKLNLVTHMHLDHVGLARRVRERSGAPLVMSQIDADRMRTAEFDAEAETEYRESLFQCVDAPETLRQQVRANADSGRRLSAYTPPDAEISALSEPLPLAPEWTAIWTPGHTAGHLSLFRETDRVLIAGDAVLSTISATIWVNPQRTDPVGDYRATLQRLRDLDPAWILGGHGEPVRGTSRIDELRKELDRESRRVQESVEGQPSTALEISDRRYARRELPPANRWLAVRETLAHLEHLASRGEVVRLTEGRVVRFALPAG